MGTRAAALLGLAAVLSACDSRPPAPVQRGAAPLREVSEIQKTASNPAPVVDPTGSVQTYKGAKHELGCENNLRQIYMCMTAYSAASGNYPEAGKFFKSMFDANVLGEASVCAMPRSGITSMADVVAMKKGVYRTTMDRLNDSTPSDKPIVWDPVPMEGGRHVLKFGGSVDVMSEEQLTAALAKYEGK
ncbi:MAG: hypothetical protein HYY18_02730 [Planctomycetes bacterium]|nr:hypothetical protein [Planctomycetota bacterium]